MKPPAIFFLLLVLAASVFYYEEYYHQKVSLIIPDLKVIPVRNGLTIKNAQVKMVNSDGIVFMCDRGMVQATFDDLPPEFRAYYGSKISPDSASAQSAALPPHKQAVTPSGPSPEELEQRKTAAAQQIAGLEAAIQQEESLISQYETQPVDTQGGISYSQYQAAKAYEEQLKNQMNQLESGNY